MNTAMTLRDFKEMILFEDDDIIVINKPAFVPSVHERGKTTHISVLELARLYFPESTLCHRIDRETSGALIIAKNAAAYRDISIQFEKRQIKKIYHAIVEGQIKFEEFTINLPINADELDNVRIDKTNGKPAITTFQTLELFKHFTLMQCEPLTGRMHQIRVHLYSQNASIAGDKRYGGKFTFLSEIKRKFKGEDRHLINRFALHAYSIGFHLPSGKPIEIHAPYANDMAVFLKLLRKYDAI